MINSLVDGSESVGFPSADNPVVLTSWKLVQQRMGSWTIEAEFDWTGPLDSLWDGRQYVLFRGERYVVQGCPSSRKTSSSRMYRHSVSFVSERDAVLGNVYFYDAVSPDADPADGYRSNTTRFSFYGTLAEYAARLDSSLAYRGLAWTVEVEEGISTDPAEVSFEGQTFMQALQTGFETYGVPYRYDGTKIVFGYSDTPLAHVFRYGPDCGLREVGRNDAGDAVVNRATGEGSSDNIPHYYPNSSPKGDLVAEAGASNRGVMQDDIVISDYVKYASAVDIGGGLRYDIPPVDEVVSRLDKEEQPVSGFTMRIEKKQSGTHFGDVMFHAYEAGSTVLTIECTTEVTSMPAAAGGMIIRDAEARPHLYAIKIRTETSDGSGMYRMFKDIGEGEPYMEEAENLGDSKWKYTFRFPVEIPASGGMWFEYIPSCVFYLHGSPANTSGAAANLEISVSVESAGAVHWTDVSSGEPVSLQDVGLYLKAGVEPADGDLIIQRKTGWITPTGCLMPPVYRESGGSERFYNALEDTYVKDDGSFYSFGSQYNPLRPVEAIQSFDDIKPSIEGVENAAGQLIGQFLDVAFDDDDRDQTDEDGKYVHPRFFVRLPKTDGPYGFNLFGSAIETDNMTFVMTSGHCAPCKFDVQVGKETGMNVVKVGSDGMPERDSDGNVVVTDVGIEGQAAQNDTENNEVWVALEKDEDTFGTVMPSATVRPQKGDTFVITGITLPQGYILAAEDRLEKAILDWMEENSRPKPEYSLSLGQAFLVRNPGIVQTLGPDSRLMVEYDGKEVLLYVSQYTAQVTAGSPHPKVTVTLAENVSINTGGFRRQLGQVSDSVRASVTADIPAIGSAYFMRKDIPDTVPSVPTFAAGVRIGAFQRGTMGAGGAVTVDADGSSRAEFDHLTVRKSAFFNSVTVQDTKHAGGRLVLSSAAMLCSRVEAVDSGWRCYFETQDSSGREIYNEFSEGDQALCQSFNEWRQRYYWRLVTAVGYDWIELSETDCDAGSGVPQAGDEIVQLGNRTDTSRQSAQVLSSFGDGAPSYIVYNGIDSYSLAGKNIAGIVYDPSKGEPQAYCYGSMYIGDRDLDADDATFMTFQQKEGETKKRLFVSADIKIGEGSSGLSNLEEWGELDSSIADLNAAAAAAQAAADAAQDTADTVSGRIDRWADDGIISPVEKQGLKDELARIRADRSDVLAGYSKYGLGSPDAYEAAFSAYEDSLTAMTASSPEDIPVPEGFDSIQKTYFDSWADALDAIAQAAKTAVTNAQESANDAQQTASEALLMAQESKDYIDNTLPDEIAEINRKLDGVVETWFYPYSPTLQNEPAVSWIRDGEQEKHIGDMFLNNQEYVDNETTPDAGKAWRWEKNTSGAYFWNPVADSDAVKALQDAAKAQDTADQKRRVFVTTPYTPYDVGDMWVQGSAGDIMRCIKARATGSYTASDWDKAGKYTDDTVAKDALSKAGNAQSAADAAQQEADQARKEAEAAQNAADAAQAAADAAQDTADEARGDADTANGLLSDLMSDSVITPPEKTALRQQHSDIKAEYSQILADAGKYGIGTSAYTSAYNAANSALAKYTADTPQNIPVGSDYNSISAYYTARQAILDSIATAAKKVATDAQSAADAAQDTADMAQDAADTAQSTADAAQDTADEAAANASSALQKIAAAQADIQDVQSDVNGLQGDINDLDAYVDGAFRDGVIDEAEAIAIGKYVNTVNESWTDLQASYNVVYNNSYLTGTAKTNLKSAYDTLSSRKNTLITAINTAVSQPTTANVTAVDTAFTNYTSAVSAFQTAVENANKAIQDALKGYTDAQIDEIQNDYEQSIATALDQSKDYTDTAKAAIQQSIEALESSKADLSDIYTKSQVDGKVSDAEADAIQAAKEAADAADAALQTVVKAYADGIVDEAEANAIAQANAYAEEKASEARKAAEAAQILAAASMGNMLYTDPEFRKGTNNITAYRLYNAPASANPTLTRKTVAGAPNTSGYGIEIVCPEGQAGFCFTTQTRANRMLVCRFVAKIPEGRTLTHATNATGTDSTLMWLTDKAGTGQWEEYAFYVKAGASGSFSTTFYFYITQAASTTWYLAYATVFDISAASALIEDVANAQIAADAAQDTADSLKNFTDTAFTDGVIDRAEAAAIEKYTNSVNETLKSVQGTYSALYGNSYLTGTPKTNLYTAYNAVVQAVNSLLAAIADAIEDSVATADDKAAVDSAYATLNTRLQAFQTAVENANKAIQDALKDYADDLEAQIKTDYDYLKETFGQVTDSTGVYLSKMVAVKDANNEVQAFMNGSDLGKDTTHGKLLIAAGVSDIENPQNAATRIYEDGTIDTTRLIGREGGKIGPFSITSMGMEYSSGNISMKTNYQYVEISRNTSDKIRRTIGLYGYSSSMASGETGIMSIMDYSAASSYDKQKKVIGVMSNVSGVPLSFMLGALYSGSFAFYSEAGLFAGLRPMIRTISANTTLNVLDHTIVSDPGSNSVTLTVTLPSVNGCEAGQQYFLLRATGHIFLRSTENRLHDSQQDNWSVASATISTSWLCMIVLATDHNGDKYWYLFRLA